MKSRADRRNIIKPNIISILLHDSFEFGILIKGIDGLLEIVGGILLMFLNPSSLNKLVKLLTQHELARWHKDLIANFLVRFAGNFSVSAQHFGVFYLLSHGAVKIILIWLLWLKKLWAYPLTIFFLFLFILYQVYRYTYSHSFFLIILTFFDIIMIYLAWVEYKRIKAL